MKRSLWISTLLLSFSLTLAATRGDEWLSRRNETELALKLARQVSSQTRALSVYATEAGVETPLFWAVRLLNQGPEGKLLKVSKIQRPAGAGESYLIRESSVFDYESILNPTTGDGVRVEISLGYRGFLGARSPLRHDLNWVLFFVTVQALLFFAVGILSGALRYASSEGPLSGNSRAA